MSDGTDMDYRIANQLKDLENKLESDIQRIELTLARIEALLTPLVEANSARLHRKAASRWNESGR